MRNYGYFIYTNFVSIKKADRLRLPRLKSH